MKKNSYFFVTLSSDCRLWPFILTSRVLFVLFIVIITATCLNGATLTITQHGVTWTFSTPIEYGQFVTGDYYVLDPGGGVTVTSVTPSWTGSLHGSMLNPVPKKGQAFTKNGYDYNETLHISFPLTVTAGDALLSSVSITTKINDWAGKNVGSNAHTKTVCILTVLDKPPPAGTFRPCPSDRSQTLYNVSQINTSVLPKKSVSGITLPSHPSFGTIEYFERGFARPWILFGNDWQSRTIHPVQQMFNYHQQIGEFLAEASLLLMTDVPGLTNILYGFIQVGIDYFHTGVSDSATWAMPIVITGLLLDNPSMYNFWINNPSVRTGRGHEKLYYIGDRTEAISSSIIEKGKTWVNWSTSEGKYVAFSKQIGEEYEHLHPSEWTCYKPHCKGEVYRTQHDVYPFVGMILTTILLDYKSRLDVNAMLNHPPLRDYCDRWMNDGFETELYGSTGRTYREEMEHYQSVSVWYRTYGSGGSPFINEMWSHYRDN